MDDGIRQYQQSNSTSVASTKGSREIPNARIERGECPDCGLKTHRIGRFKNPKPLTVPGYVLNGLCLLCNPIARPYNQHRIEKIMTDGEGSLVSALTFGPNDLAYEPSNFHQHIHSRKKAPERPSLMHTEISELVDEDDTEVSEIYHPLRTLTIEEAMERGKVLAEEEELSVRFTGEDVRRIKIMHTSINMKESEEVEEIDGKMSSASAPEAEFAYYDRNSAIHKRPLHQNLKDDSKGERIVTNGIVVEEIDLNRKQKAKRQLSPESAFKERLKYFSQKNPRFATSYQSSANNTGTNALKNASINRSKSDGNRLIQNKLQEYLTARESAEVPETNPRKEMLKRSQSEGDKNIQKKLSTYLKSSSRDYHGEYPDIPPPPFPVWENKTSSMPPVLTRFLSENTCTSVRATHGVPGFASYDKPNELPSFEQINIRQDDGNVSEIHAFDDRSEYSARDNLVDGKKIPTQLKRSRTAPVGPVGKEAVTTGLKKMVSFHKSKTGSMESDWGTSSSVSYGSEIHSKVSHPRGRLQPILRKRSIDSRSTTSLRKNFTQENANDNESSATSISERVKKMRDEDDSFIERKMKEIAEFDNYEEDDKQNKNLKKEKVLKTRLTQLGSSTSRDLDHAFVDYQLRKLNGKNTDLSDKVSPPKPSKSYADLSKDKPTNNLSVFFKKNNLSHIQNPMSLVVKHGTTSKLDPNRTSLISDDDDSELLMNQTLLGLNDGAYVTGNESDSINRPTLIVNSHSYSNRKPDFSSSPQSNHDQMRTPDTTGNVNDFISSDHGDFHIQNTGSRTDPKKPSPVEKHNYKYRGDDMEFFSQDIKKPSMETSSLISVKKLIDSDSSPRENIPILLHLMANRVSNSQALLLALDCLRVKAVKKEVKEVIFESKGVKTVVDIIWSNLEDCGILIASCQALWAISTDCDDHQKNICADSGAAEAILCCMQGHLDHVDLLSMACGVLGSFCLHEDKFNLMSMGIIMSIASIMKLHPHRASLQVWCIRAMWALCKSDKAGEIKIELDKSGCVRLTCMAMKKESHRETLEWGTRLLCCVSRNYAVAEKLLEIEDSLLSVALYPLEQDDIDHSLILLLISNLCPALKRDDSEIGGIPIDNLIKNTVSVMRTHPSDDHIQLYGCSVLSKFAMKNPEHRYAIISRDGIKVAYNAIKYFSDSQKIEEQAYFVLFYCSESSEGRLLFSYDMILFLVRRLVAWQYSQNTKIIELIYAITASLSIEKDIHSAILSSGVITVTIDVMFHHTREPSIQESACTFLRNLSRSKSMFDDLMNAGAVQCLVSAMKANQGVLSIQESACVSLWNFSTGSKHRTSVILEHGGVQAIIAGMQSHDQSDKMQEIACGTLWSLISNCQSDKHDCRSMIGGNGIDAIICAMFTYPSAEAILQNACGAISALSSDSSICSSLVSNGGIDALIETMRRNISNINILEFGCICLRNIVIWNAAEEQNVTDIIRVILRCMRQHPNEKRVQRHACCVLWSLTSSIQFVTKAKNEIIAGGGMDLIMAILANTDWDLDIQREAREALETLIT